ncbi:MAG: Gfo/Idh/MocA family oxidoreductase [Cyclobacteriaceae bacterium]|nr:Gfo/Idh/MocA family oxidoreductase [Cyclobacteriaceae bacterium]
MENKNLKRREFLSKSFAAMATIAIVPRNVLGGPGYVAPSDKIVLGFIGTGKQSRGLASQFLRLPDAQMVAASDVYETKLDAFKNVVQQYYTENTGSGFKGLSTYKNYLELLERSDIDAVIIASPDHWHAVHSVHAANKKKHVFCEKPLSLTVEEGRSMVKAARKNNIVFQTGSMQRSNDGFRKACELVINGYIGELKNVKVNVGDPAVPYDLPAETVPANLDWDMWCGPTQVLPFNEKLAPSSWDGPWPAWRNYKETGGGILADWGAHMFDIAQWGLGADDTGPVQYIPPTDRNATRGLKMVYANGLEMFHEDFGRGWAVEFNGTEGTLQVSRSFMDTKPEKIATVEIKSTDKRLYHSDNHYADWLSCIRTGKKPICDVEVGHRSASVCNIANIAYWMGRPLNFDPVKEKFAKDKEANKLLGRKLRKPYRY